MEVPCYAARFVTPFAQALATYERVAPESIKRLKAIDPSTRIPAGVANGLAVAQVEETGDPDLGFKAAEAMPLGRAGALDYAMQSASTLRAAVDVGARYTRSFSDLLQVGCDVEGARARIRFDFGRAPRPIVDFTMSAWYANHLRAPLLDARAECWISHARPANSGAYERAFRSTALRFDAPFYGFTFDREHLDAPLPAADETLHALLCEHVAVAVADLSTRRTIVARVREIAVRDLTGGQPGILSVARQLRMSPKTLARRLEREGTTFSATVDELRSELALRYVGGHASTFTEIAFRLGFSHVEAFQRAFKRWTGETPLAYRRLLRHAPPARRAPGEPRAAGHF
jgi:AraC-like DNA-binding protein